jgi:hypothetical protein
MVPGVEDDTEYLFIAKLSLRCKRLSKQARRKETPMLPLPLQLTRPIELATSLEASLKEAFEVESTQYNPKTQVRETAAGTPLILNWGARAPTAIVAPYSRLWWSSTLISRSMITTSFKGCEHLRFLTEVVSPDPACGRHFPGAWVP